MAKEIIRNSDAVIYQTTNVGQYGDCGVDLIDPNNPEHWAQIAIDAAEDAAAAADKAQEIADSIVASSGSIVFDTVADMLASSVVKKSLEDGTNLRVSTMGYHKKSGIGGATYDIWDKDKFKSHFDPSWEPDGAGDHDIPDSNNVAILRTNGKFWAGQLGLLDPLEDEEEARRLGITHHQSLQKAADYVKRRIDYLHRVNGKGYRHILILHVENGRYFMNGTVFMPAGVFLCGGSDWGQTPCVEFKPYKDLNPGENNIENYFPRRSQKVLNSVWEPLIDGTDGVMATSVPYEFGADSKRGDHYSGFVKLNSIDEDQTIFSDSNDPKTRVWWSAANSAIRATLNVKNPDGSEQFIVFPPQRQTENQIMGGTTISISKRVMLAYNNPSAPVSWSDWKISVGSTFDTVLADNNDGKVSFDTLYNAGDGLSPMNGSIQYVVVGQDWPLDDSGTDEIPSDGEKLYWRYTEGTLKSADMPTENYLYEENQDDDIDANWYFKGMGNHMWRIKTEYEQNDRTGYMFIWNTVTEVDPNTGEDLRGIAPDEDVYLAQYTGGASGITLSNYETNERTVDPAHPDPLPSGDHWLDPNWKPNYLRLINGYMTFGSGMFVSLRTERISTTIHRPSYFSYGDYYTDRHFIQDLECGIQRENDRWAIDINGAGDAVTLNNLSFPVNHPSQWVYGTFYPMGEYMNGPAKAVKFQTTAFSWPNWKEFVGTSTSGAEISRLVNGSVKLIGTRNMTISDSHFEFGNIILDDSSANIKNCYFSQFRGADYPDIDMRSGLYQNFGKTVTIENCEFHRGYDADHWPKTKWNIITSPCYNVNIKTAQQGWALGGNENQEIAPTFGYRPELPKDNIYPDTHVEEGITELPGWSRWAPYLRDCRILRGHIVPQTLRRTMEGFGGVGDIFILPVSQRADGLYWWDHHKGEKYPWGTYFYNAQWIIDKGDEVQEVLDPNFIPLGKNPQDPVGQEKEITIAPGGSTEEPDARPVISMYPDGSAIPEGWLRFYRGTESKKYSHYVDIPTSSMVTFDDNGSQMYMRDWKEMPSMDINPTTGTNMLPLYEPELGKEYELDVRGGAYIDWSKPDAKPDVGTGGWSLVQSVTNRVYKDANHESPVESYVMDSVGIWVDKPFEPAPGEDEGHVYCNLPLDGEFIPWNNTNFKIPEGAKTTLIRDESASGDEWYLRVNYTDKGGKQVVIAELLPGMSVTCIYSHGAWHAIDWGGFIKRKTYSIGADNMGEWVNLSIPGVEEYVVTFDAPIKNPAGGHPSDFDVWYSVDLQPEIGTRVQFVASKESGFKNPDLASHLYGWNKVFLTYDDPNIEGDDKTVYLGILQFPGDHFTVTRTANGWEITERAELPELHHYPDDEQTMSYTVPTDGFMKQVNHLSYNMSSSGDPEVYLQLDAKQWAFQPIKDGAIARVQLEEMWDPKNSVIVQLANKVEGPAGITDWPDRLQYPGDFLEFVWRERDPIDTTNKDGVWKLSKSQIGTPKTEALKIMKGPYTDASSIDDDFKSIPLASFNGNTYTTLWPTDLPVDAWLSLPDVGDGWNKELKIGTRYTFITDMTQDGSALIVQDNKNHTKTTLPYRSATTFYYTGNRWIMENQTNNVIS